MSGVVNKIKEKVDQVVHPDRHQTHAGTHTGPHTGTAGTTGLPGTHSGSNTAGPHSSNIANKVDPRVDSDRDGSNNFGAAHGGHTTGLTGTAGSTNAGPHNSNLANKLDPRADSDRDGSRNVGAAAYGPGSHQNSSGFANTGLGSGSTNHGPHSSNLANKVDPRVDSDRDGSHNAGAAAYGPGGHSSGGLGSSGFGSGSAGIGSGTGPAANTAGPHSSNLANKLDPRVDSDLDGSRKVGPGGSTY